MILGNCIIKKKKTGCSYEGGLFFLALIFGA